MSPLRPVSALLLALVLGCEPIPDVRFDAEDGGDGAGGSCQAPPGDTCCGDIVCRGACTPQQCDQCVQQACNRDAEVCCPNPAGMIRCRPADRPCGA